MAHYYVATESDGGNDYNTGSQTLPWLTAAHAIVTATTFGDIIHFNSGIFHIYNQLKLYPGVSIEGKGNTTILQTSITGEVTIWAVSNEGTNGNQSISYIRMEGGMTATTPIYFVGRSNVSIHHCEFEDFFTTGPSISGGSTGTEPTIYASGCSLHDNIITNCGDYQGSGKYGNGRGNIEIGGLSGMLIYNNTITQEDRGVDANGYCIKGTNDGYYKGLKIYNNTITKPPYDGSTWDFAIELWSQRGGIEIYDNTIQGGIDLGGYGTNDDGGYGYAVKIYNNILGQSALRSDEELGLHLELSQSEGVYIYGNTFKNLTTGIECYQNSTDIFEDVYIYSNIFQNLGINGQANSGTVIKFGTIGSSTVAYDNVNFVNNTIVGNTSGYSSNGIQLQFAGPATNITIRNNIITGFSLYSIICNSDNGGTITGMSVENNTFYNNGINTPSFVGVTNLTNQNNITSDPLFISSSQYYLQSDSPSKWTGLHIDSFILDRDGNVFAATTSRGAYEFGGVPPDDILVTAITVTGEGSATTITIDKGTLQMYAHIDPHNATNQTVTWSVINSTGSASIGDTGLLTALTNGTITVKATSNSN